MTPGSIDKDDRDRWMRISIGVAVSIALHALMLSAYRGPSAPPLEEPQLGQPLSVWLRHVPPPSLPKAVDPETPAKTQSRKERPRAQRQPRRVITVPDKTPAEREEPFTVEQAPETEPEPDSPRFDREAALRMARSLANMPDPEREGTPVGQFPKKPYATESQLARSIAAAKRRDCKDGLPGGLLGPIIIMFDKKDSGCKW